MIKYNKCRGLIIMAVGIALGISPVNAQQAKAPSITPLSPNAAALWKYTEIPVSMFTGIPSISIPLYEIKSGSIKVPISLTYHAGGHRVEDQASWVGLGWSLQAGGSVTRNIKGLADELDWMKPTSPYRTDADGCSYEYFSNVLIQTHDVQPDEFSFSAPGINGRFMYQNGAAEPVQIPYRPVRVQRELTGSNFSTLNMFVATDESGTKFRFGNYQSHNTPVVEIPNGPNASPSSWLLTEIESADQTDKVTFNYLSAGSVQKNSETHSISVIDQSVGPNLQENCPSRVPASISAFTTTSSVYVTSTFVLSEILFENGKIEFVQSATNRTDLFSSQKSLEYVKVYSLQKGSYRLEKIYKFLYSYFKKEENLAQTDWKLKLDAVESYSSDNVKIERYTFDYHTNYFNTDNNNAIDYWGYYNGKINNTNKIPRQLIPYDQNNWGVVMTEIGGADRSTNPAFMKQGVLQRINYPTGGFTEFDFETNVYDSSGVTAYAGALRVTSITTKESVNAPAMVKTYKYGQGEIGRGSKNFLNNPGYFVTTNRQVQSTGQGVSGCAASYYTLRIFSSSSSLSIDGFDGAPVVYPYVTEYLGTVTTNIGKTLFEFDGGAPPVDNLALIYSNTTNTFQRLSQHWKRGQQTRKTVLNAQGQKVSETFTSYNDIHPLNISNFGLLVSQNDILLGYYPGTDCWKHLGMPRYGYNYYSLTTGVMLPVKAVERLYDLANPGKYFETEVLSTYDADYLQLLRTETNTKKSLTGYQEITVQENKYPMQYGFTSTPSGPNAEGIKNLQTLHILNAPVEQYTVKKIFNGSSWTESVTGGLLTTYKSAKPNPDVVYELAITTPLSVGAFGTGSSIVGNAFVKSTSYSPRLSFSNYDASGNPLQFQKQGAAPQSYIWGYNNAYPIAEIANSDRDQVAYSSFEEETDASTNWSYTGSAANTVGGITGEYAYQLFGSNEPTRSNLNSGNTYIVSYWTRNSTAYSIAGTIGTAKEGRSVGGWKYFEHRVTGQTQIAVSGTGWIDELRLFPDGALMTTFTHKPLLGLSAKCDPGNRISYFEYDKFGRLLLIRDQDNNILKTYEYNYKQ